MISSIRPFRLQNRAGTNRSGTARFSTNRPGIWLAGALWFACMPGIGMAESDVDPFNGESVSIEQTRAEVSLVRAQNELLGEQTKKARAEFMLKNGDRIFAAELKKQLDAAGGGRFYGGAYPGVALPEPVRKPMAVQLPRIAKKRAVVPPRDIKAMQLPVPGHTGVHFLGTYDQSGQRLALISQNGQLYRAAVGQNVPGIGMVSSLDNGAAVIGGAQYRTDALPVSDVDRQDISVLAKMAMRQSGAGGGVPVGFATAQTASPSSPGIPPAVFNP